MRGMQGMRTEQHARDDLREWTFPEEDRALFTTAPWRGEYRWFRSPNVVCLEQWRRKKAQQRLQHENRD
jgi:hypothetical protein